MPEPPAEQPYDPAADYVTVAVAADTLKIQAQTLRTAIKEGRIPVVRVFGRVLLTPEAVEEYRKRTQPNGEVKNGRPKKQE